MTFRSTTKPRFVISRKPASSENSGSVAPRAQVAMLVVLVRSPDTIGDPPPSQTTGAFAADIEGSSRNDVLPTLRRAPSERDRTGPEHWTGPSPRADDGTRTRDPHLGKVGGVATLVWSSALTCSPVRPILQSVRPNPACCISVYLPQFLRNPDAQRLPPFGSCQSMASLPSVLAEHSVRHESSA
jgi:hypothetical protein